jgi:aspartate aminotransferase
MARTPTSPELGVRNPPENHLNLNVRGMGPSATVAINERSNQLLAEGRSIIKLGLGQSPFPVPPRVVEALQAHAHEKDYLPVKGLRTLRRAVAEHTARTTGLTDRTADDVLIGPGSKELMFLLQLVYCGDLVIPSPAWVSYAPQARILGRTVRFIPSHPDNGFMITADAFARLCAEDPGRPRVVILNYPSNPTGATFGREELAAIAEVAREHGVVLLSDEIYGAVHHTGDHVSIAVFYPEGTIVSSGLSKWCGAGGWRLGTFVFPPELRWLLDAMAAAASETYTSTSAPIQHAAVTAFQGGPDIDAYLEGSRRILGMLGTWVHRRLGAAGIRAPAPAGGFYLFPNFEHVRERLARRGIATSRALCEQLIGETGVAILPGDDFGRPPDELTARLAYVDFDGEAALEAIATDEGRLLPGDHVDEGFLRACAPRVLEGIDRICDWIE